MELVELALNLPPGDLARAAKKAGISGNVREEEIKKRVLKGYTKKEEGRGGQLDD